MALTSALGQFIADLSPNRIPDEAVRIAHMGIIDCIGTMIVGRTEPCTQILKDVLAPAHGPASLYFSGEQSSGPEAGWINGCSAPGSLDTSLSHAAGLIEIAACHA